MDRMQRTHDHSQGPWKYPPTPERKPIAWGVTFLIALTSAGALAVLAAIFIGKVIANLAHYAVWGL